jgi:ribonucleoside-diphosphate reductase alpha chain
MPVAGTKASLGEVKENDFNFPAPMDMTNISANYDTSWLLEFWKTGQVGEVFLKNCEQALSTAEPGFSFNFFDKENETLRNACTEVTSEDDSDVCNLGSVNMGRVDSLEEFRTIVHLATKFLVCGTLKAHLPFEKIMEVRKKNRRLGLGPDGSSRMAAEAWWELRSQPELHTLVGSIA